MKFFKHFSYAYIVNSRSELSVRKCTCTTLAKLYIGVFIESSVFKKSFNVFFSLLNTLSSFNKCYFYTSKD